MATAKRVRELITRHGTLISSIIEQGPLTRGQLGKALGVAQPTITRRTAELLKAGILFEGENASDETRLGRPSRLLDLTPRMCYIAALHLGRVDVELGLVSLKGEVVAKRTLEGDSHDEAEPGPLIDRAIDGLRALWTEMGVSEREILGLGVATTGVVDPATGTEARFWLDGGRLVRTDVPVREKLAATVRLPTHIETNAWAMAMGDRWFGNRERDFTLFHVNAGAAASLVVKGELYRGQGAAGEIAHTRVGASRRLCTCGKRGCLEAIVSRAAILADVARFHNVGGIWDVVDLALKGDPDVLAVLARCADAIGTASTSIVDLLDPKALVLSGPIFTVPHVFNAVKDFVRHNSFTGRMGRVQVLRSPLGADIALIGAASLVIGSLVSGGPLDGQESIAEDYIDGDIAESG